MSLKLVVLFFSTKNHSIMILNGKFILNSHILLLNEVQLSNFNNTHVSIFHFLVVSYLFTNLLKDLKWFTLTCKTGKN